MQVETVYPTQFQLHLFHEGNLFESYKLLGSHVHRKKEEVYTIFCVWAPNAQSIGLVGDFNNWEADKYPLERINNEGIWFIKIDKDLTGALYKYQITSSEGNTFLKSDPYAFYSEVRPNTASIVYSLDGYKWNDARWRQKKAKKNSLNEPLAIYEVHLGSWKLHEDESLYTYRELADELIPYCLEQGFTHLEILPLVEHPLDISWGYQGTGYYSATSRFGEPKDLMYFIDQCHQNGLGVILDWVPGHFCKDAHGLYQFDGSSQFDYANAKDRENLVWGTANFDLGKMEVHSFLISNALFWMEYFHVDGFRVDAVSNIIYWPNSNENSMNPYGIEFLQKLNKMVAQYDPTILMFAEDSTDWPQVTAPVHYGGIGFHYKWNMGWMNDFLKYMETESQYRKDMHDKVSFSLHYAFSENFVLPLSHDEVVHGKKSLLNKMPGDYWQKFAQFRLLIGFMMAHPGKKLLFMGAEFAQFSEWKDKEQLDWLLYDYDMHKKANDFIKAILKIYKRSKPLYELDHVYEGFEWIDVNNRDQSIFSFIRKGKKPEDFLIVICNFTYHTYEDYLIGVPNDGSYREILNSDAEEFGGANYINKKVIKAQEGSFHGRPFSVQLTIPAFSITILRPVQHRKERKGNGKEEMRGNAIGRRQGE
ncbi:1,4-alpha-glucan branching protein GlgB [Niallia nealsonii]|uniref:1,4-alpha-glucan branching enzyme GlgB n=1 Tax=Niallia nealsonii TaxID=115979 RepID=A0A2N0YY89_9BACI|nr:1,4-alpha-glucan branching protein GlgB [Niallia nealsonii]PKG22224.1 1,4-alpha-glucan branching enzyme [Niallia nealsonii]